MNPENPQNTPQPQNDTPQPATQNQAPTTEHTETKTYQAGTDSTAVAGPVPGKGLGIASFVVSLLGFGLIGLIMGIVARSQSKKAGFGNGFALAGIIIGALNIIAGIAIAIFIASSAANLTNCTTDTTGGTASQSCSVDTTTVPSTTPVTE